jgi:predicted transglutaminase-like cysteine proteinase
VGAQSFCGAAKRTDSILSKTVAVAAWANISRSVLDDSCAQVVIKLFGVALFASATVSRAQEHAPYIGIGPVTSAPIGWAEFCVEYAPECDTTPSVPRDVVLSTRAWTELKRINIAVNTSVKPMTDMDHWGVVERWKTMATAIARIMRCRSASS